MLIVMLQDIAPMYYDIDSFKKGEIKNGLQRTADKIRRKQAAKK